jgi:hypothetical protein
MGLHPDQGDARREEGGPTIGWDEEDRIRIPEVELEDRRRTGVHRVHDNGVAEASVAVTVVANERLQRRQRPDEAEAVRNGDTIGHRECSAILP